MQHFPDLALHRQIHVFARFPPALKLSSILSLLLVPLLLVKEGELGLFGALVLRYRHTSRRSIWRFAL